MTTTQQAEAIKLAIRELSDGSHEDLIATLETLLPVEKPKPAEVFLGFSSYKGKTWIARVVGFGGKFGVEREFINPISRDMSRSGKTGMGTWMLDQGLYEICEEGKKRFETVDAGGNRETVSAAEAREMI